MREFFQEAVAFLGFLAIMALLIYVASVSDRLDAAIIGRA
jgi:hypothetical protein